MKWKQKKYDKEIKDKLVSEGLSPFFATIIANRDSDIKQKSDIPSYIKCSVDDMGNPMDIANMDKALEIIKKKHKSAIIFGDYDVDGVTSSFLMRRLLRLLEVEAVDIFLPHRMYDGYGLNDKSVDNFLHLTRNRNYDLVIVLDCGSSSEKYVKMIREQNDGDMFIMDHHIIEEESESVSADALVNPRINDAEPLCTAGLVYQLHRAVFGEEYDDLMVPYAAIGTVADVCVLKGTNRNIVKRGLDAMARVEDIGINSLLKAFKISNRFCTCDDIGFSIAPAINSAGRLKHPGIALDLLECKDFEKSVINAEELKNLNEKRKDIQKDMVSTIGGKVGDIGDRQSILIYDESWHTGLVGIVAARVAETYHVPAICFGKGDEGEITGSARSRTGIHIKKVMDKCSHIFERYGGHEQAAGATLKEEYADQAWDIFDNAVKDYLSENDTETNVIPYDVEMDFNLMTKFNNDLCKRLEELGPFGNGNPKPKILLRNIQCNKVNEWASNKGGIVILHNIGLKAYALQPNLREKLEGKRVDIIFTIDRFFQDRSKWAINIEKAKISTVV